jgi:membrane protease YdiL (CAAX protease family)
MSHPDVKRNRSPSGCAGDVRGQRMPAMTSRTRGVLAFLVIAFASAWIGMFGARLVLGLSLVNPLVQLSFALTPAVAGVIVRRWVTREGFGDAGLALRLTSEWPYYLAAWLGPLVLVAASVGLAAALGLWRPDLSALDRAVPGLPGWAFILLLMGIVPVLTPLYWGEEFGWTSYLRLRLFADRPLLSTVTTGLIWAVWHYPLAFLGYVVFPNVILGLAVWTASFLLYEIILTWFRRAAVASGPRAWLTLATT